MSNQPSPTAENLEVPPDPERLAEGLRDTGYQLNTAIADIVDNSIAAGAALVQIELRMDFRGSIGLSIFDDGCGMNRQGLIDAMRYGAPRRASAASLGKFGLGLKTASTAFCRKLSVVSCAKKDDPLLRATWDLDHVARTGKWELLLDAPTEVQAKAFGEFVGGDKGTMVLWEKVDRVLKGNYSAPGGAAAKKALDRLVESLREHLGMVFQRFLDGADQRATNVSMKLNGGEVMAWDPFCVVESTLVNEDAPEVELPGGTKADFNLRAFILPRKEQFTSEEAARQARLKNQNQGVYIYRENRLIHGPDWLKMFIKEPHSTLSRAEFSFDHRLDEAFQIDIKKSQIILAEGLYDHILDFLTPARRAAEEVYRKGLRIKSGKDAAGAHDASNRNIGSKEDKLPKPDLRGSNPAAGTVDLVNTNGSVQLKIKLTRSTHPHKVLVQAVDSLDDGVLWEPSVIDDPTGTAHYGVRINTGHAYYRKVYLPNLMQGVTIQGMDALLWGLCMAELRCVSDETKETLVEMRLEVSRSLRKLVEDLPEPPETDGTV